MDKLVCNRHYQWIHLLFYKTNIQTKVILCFRAVQWADNIAYFHFRYFIYIKNRMCIVNRDRFIIWRMQQLRYFMNRVYLKNIENCLFHYGLCLLCLPVSLCILFQIFLLFPFPFSMIFTKTFALVFRINWVTLVLRDVNFCQSTVKPDFRATLRTWSLFFISWMLSGVNHRRLFLFFHCLSFLENIAIVAIIFDEKYLVQNAKLSDLKKNKTLSGSFNANFKLCSWCFVI